MNPLKLTMKHLLIILSILLLSSPVIGQSDEKCYVVVETSKDIDPSLLSNISISLISKFLRDVEQVPPSGISLDSCQYHISISKNNDTTFVTFKGEGLNSYGDSKLTGSDGFQQSILKSLYRSLKDKRDLICQDYGKLLEECNEVEVEVVKRQNGILFGTYRETKWKDGGEWKWYENDDDNRIGKYKGEVEEGLPNGQGTYITTKGHKYVGEWKEGKYHGQGTLTYPNGRKYIGEYKDGLPNGQGTLTLSSGHKYEGEYQDGKYHGQGTFTWYDGRKYVGEWKDGTEHGQGTLTLPNGDKYEGEYQDGGIHGRGTLTFLDGREYVGEFKGGNFWNGILYDKDGKYKWKYVKGVRQ